MGLSRSTYYHRSREKSIEAKKEEADLRDRIEQIVVEFARYGYRRVDLSAQARGLQGQSQAGSADNARAVATVSDQAALGEDYRQ